MKNQQDSECNLKRLKGISQTVETWVFNFLFLSQKFCKKDTTSVFHKDINVYTPATQKKNKSSKMFTPIIYIFF